MIRFLVDRSRSRRQNLRAFIEEHAARHPELRTQVYLDDFRAMATRDGVTVQLIELPPRQRARTFSVAEFQFIQLNRAMAPGEQALQGMHELCHIWRDGPTAGTFYSDELTGGESCEFADLVAWYVTSTARPFFDPPSTQLDFEL